MDSESVIPSSVGSPAVHDHSWRVWGWGVVTVSFCVGYVAVRLNQGWIPHDEGQLGLTVQRILAGELPHRDFVEPYTGGLGYYHAAWCWLGGLRAEVIRASSLPGFALYCGVLYWLALRIVSWPAATLVTMLGAALTLPIYPAAMPSWYNLFLTVAGAAALVRYHEAKQRKWLILAGLCGGLSIAVKVVGVFFVAASAAFLWYRALRIPNRLQISRSDRAPSLQTPFESHSRHADEVTPLAATSGRSGRIEGHCKPGSARLIEEACDSPMETANLVAENDATGLMSDRSRPWNNHLKRNACEPSTLERTDQDRFQNDADRISRRAWKPQLRSLPRVLTGVGLVCLTGSFMMLVMRRESFGMDLFHFGLPLVCLLILIGIPFVRVDMPTWYRATRQVTQEVGWFGVGLAIPLLILLLPYAWTGALGSFWHGVMILPWRRLTYASLPFPNEWRFLVWSLPWVLVPSLGLLSRRGARYLTALLIGMLGVQFMISFLSHQQVIMLPALRQTLPLLILTAGLTRFLVYRQPSSMHQISEGQPAGSASSPGGLSPSSMQPSSLVSEEMELFLWMVMTYAVSLVQFPYSGALYFFYAAPLGIVLALFFMNHASRLARQMTFAAGSLILIFVVDRLHDPNPVLAGGVGGRHPATVRLDLENGRIWMRKGQAEFYEKVIALIEAHSAGGSTIYAGPDCPEVCFFANRASCTRSCYGLFADQQEELGPGLRDLLQRHQVSVAVVNLFSEFTQELPEMLFKTLEERFSEQIEIVSDDPISPQTFRVYYGYRQAIP